MIPEAKDLRVGINTDAIKRFGKELIKHQDRGYLHIPAGMGTPTRTTLINALIEKGYTIDRGTFSATGNTKYIVRWV